MRIEDKMMRDLRMVPPIIRKVIGVAVDLDLQINPHDSHTMVADVETFFLVEIGSGNKTK